VIRRIVIVGGGTAGWMTAAALSRGLGATHEITLVESDRIGTIGVGEATVPSIREFNRYLRIDEDAFVRATSGSFKLGIEFVGWNGVGSRYFHPFGFLGPDMAGADFHHVWLRHLAAGGDADLGRINPETAAARAGRFARDTRHGPISHAFHFDAMRYAAFLRAYAENKGVVRIEGEVTAAERDHETGDIAAIRFASGQVIAGDLFIDCSGFRGLLIEGELKTGYIDWSHWLPCDRAVAMPCERIADPTPFTRSTAREAGWQWRIPLQHRTGNGYVYCSHFLNDDEAAALLAGRLDAKPLGDPNLLRFTPGHRKLFWNRNCVAIGLAGGFLEPLESTSIHLIQTAIIRLLGVFPGDQIDQRLVDRFNRESRAEYEAVRDFVLAHYVLTAGRDTPFWQAVRDVAPPDSLAERIAVFRETGTILHDRGDFFGPTNWFAILTGQGCHATAWHPLVGALDGKIVADRIAALEARTAQMIAGLPSHADFIAANCAA
jgi:tryptophan halogenase